jgi:hypothetical protein
MGGAEVISIRVANRKNTREGRYVGRPTLLGNPYRVEAFGREGAVRRYREWFSRVKSEGKVAQALAALEREAEKRKTLTLLCWCAPEPCHAEVVAEEIASRLERKGYRVEVCVDGRG